MNDDAKHLPVMYPGDNGKLVYYNNRPQPQGSSVSQQSPSPVTATATHLPQSTTATHLPQSSGRNAGNAPTAQRVIESLKEGSLSKVTSNMWKDFVRTYNNHAQSLNSTTGVVRARLINVVADWVRTGGNSRDLHLDTDMRKDFDAFMQANSGESSNIRRVVDKARILAKVRGGGGEFVAWYNRLDDSIRNNEYLYVSILNAEVANGVSALHGIQTSAAYATWKAERPANGASKVGRLPTQQKPPRGAAGLRARQHRGILAAPRPLATQPQIEGSRITKPSSGPANGASSRVNRDASRALHPLLPTPGRGANGRGSPLSPFVANAGPGPIPTTYSADPRREHAAYPFNTTTQSGTDLGHLTASSSYRSASHSQTAIEAGVQHRSSQSSPQAPLIRPPGQSPRMPYGLVYVGSHGVNPAQEEYAPQVQAWQEVHSGHRGNYLGQNWPGQ